ncbi:2-hydroxyhepta-2,4-diene-1,7-dioate isomerase [Bacillus sp. AFS076308]|uniref:fumarylacetoacetate hydrolase family protein n=1 Tax=unclassified Bacillus (in: firmicutes) TaxID=185979 RepID=UPI000BF9387E|nr:MULTISPECIES: fumarylacetoacetate hydrolase family protein [unclassified Bacillus (in: firmicutes)]PFO06865.1 2-hydroxyhepta-2,4-diene-1,7-dioate isomerase [Bacillus sp. AFS076308]PGV55296.1 2-hydroxyhepta-2,4-diene-1,7-dioate isomerase [Bacillus sp. AFS037270]
MKIAIFNEDVLGVVKGDSVVDVSNLAGWNAGSPRESFLRLIDDFDEIKVRIERDIETCPSYLLSNVTLKSPVPGTGKIWAAPVNYRNHQKEMNELFNNAPRTIEELGLFLKSPDSLSGPNDPIVLPFKDRRTDHEAELGYVIGKKAKNISSSEAKDYIFGYFALLDISIRGNEERTWRKSFDTFTPIGPWIVTSDEIVNPNDLDMKLWVNDELRQEGNTKYLIYDCFKCFELANQDMTLQPGDIIATGTPAGVGPIESGDTVRIKIERVGEFSVDVRYSDKYLKEYETSK